jgi:hypothetical protein
MEADWKRYTSLPCAVNADAGQAGSQSPQAPPVAALSKLPARFTLAGGGVCEASTDTGPIAPIKMVIRLIAVINGRSLLIYIAILLGYSSIYYFIPQFVF